MPAKEQVHAEEEGRPAVNGLSWGWGSGSPRSCGMGLGTSPRLFGTGGCGRDGGLMSIVLHEEAATGNEVTRRMKLEKQGLNRRECSEGRIWGKVAKS